MTTDTKTLTLYPIELVCFTVSLLRTVEGEIHGARKDVMLVDRAPYGVYGKDLMAWLVRPGTRVGFLSVFKTEVAALGAALRYLAELHATEPESILRFSIVSTWRMLGPDTSASGEHHKFEIHVDVSQQAVTAANFDLYDHEAHAVFVRMFKAFWEGHVDFSKTKEKESVT